MFKIFSNLTQSFENITAGCILIFTATSALFWRCFHQSALISQIYTTRILGSYDSARPMPECMIWSSCCGMVNCNFIVVTD